MSQTIDEEALRREKLLEDINLIPDRTVHRINHLYLNFIGSNVIFTL